jgi:hypothetical protein
LVCGCVVPPPVPPALPPEPDVVPPDDPPTDDPVPDDPEPEVEPVGPVEVLAVGVGVDPSVIVTESGVPAS